MVAGFHNVSGMDVNVCGECGGVWFGWNQLRQIMEQGPQALDRLMDFEPRERRPDPSRAVLSCPHCHVPLHRTPLKRVATLAVNTCYSCGGIYVDAATLAELDRLSHHPAGQEATLFSAQARANAEAADRLLHEESAERKGAGAWYRFFTTRTGSKFHF